MFESDYGEMSQAGGLIYCDEACMDLLASLGKMHHDNLFIQSFELHKSVSFPMIKLVYIYIAKLKC